MPISGRRLLPCLRPRQGGSCDCRSAPGGYRLIVAREENGVDAQPESHDWSTRYPWIIEAALKNRQKQFVIDGKAVILGIEGIPNKD